MASAGDFIDFESTCSRVAQLVVVAMLLAWQALVFKVIGVVSSKILIIAQVAKTRGLQ